MNKPPMMMNKPTETQHSGMHLIGASAIPIRPFSIVPHSNDQPSLNVGVIGHVAHGKSTLVHAISGIRTGKSKNERKRSMTISLGYANTKIFKCPTCPRPSCFQSFPSNTQSAFCQNNTCDNTLEFSRHISFVDCPGHEALMATMLNGAATFHAAILVVAANEVVAPPQTKEHLAVVSMLDVPHVLTVQSKLDLVLPVEAAKHQLELRSFLRGSAAEGTPIIPISATVKANIDAVLMYICEQIPIPPPRLDRPPCLDVIRSFDVNKPGTSAAFLRGAVMGGTLAHGSLTVGDDLEVRPGLVRCLPGGAWYFYAMQTRVVSLSSEQNALHTALPGGLIGIGTTLDATCGRNDGLVGSVVGPPGTLPPVWEKLVLSIRLLPNRLLVAADFTPFGGKETLTLNIAAATVVATIVPKRTSASSDKGQRIGVRLETPMCAEIGQRLSVSRMIKGQWRVVGTGKIRKGSVAAVEVSYEEYTRLHVHPK